MKPTKQIAKPNNTHHAEGAFVVCAPTPDRKQQEGRTMTLFIVSSTVHTS